MTVLIQVLTAIALVLSIVIPITAFFHGERSKKRYTHSLAANCLTFFGILAIVAIVTLAGSRLYTSAAYDEEMIDDLIGRFDRVFAKCGRLEG